MTAAQTIPAAWRDPGAWIIGAAAAFLWLQGYPQPHIDDLFYTGAAVELSRSGQLVNPWIAPWLESLGTDRFYAQLPVLPYLLGAWLAVFGVATKSLTGFHLLAQAVVEFSTYRFARRAGLTWPTALVPAVVAGFFLLNLGMRPEALGLALVAGSQFASHPTRARRMALGALLGALAVLTHPLLMSLVVPLHVWRGLQAWRAGHLTSFCVATVIGLMISAAAFALAVRGEITEFVRTMHLFSQLLTPPWHAAPAHFWGEFTLGKQAYLLGATWSLIALSAARVLRPSAAVPYVHTLRTLWVVWFATTAIGTLLYPTRMVHYATAFGLVLAIVCWGRTRFAAAMASTSLSLMSLQHAAIILVPLFGNAEGPDATSVKAEIERHPGRKICVDDVAARFVYDFKLPAGAVDWTQRQSAHKGSRGTLLQKPPNELWIATEWKIEHNIRDSDVRAERLRLGPKTFGSIAAQPCKIVVIE